MSLHCHHSLLSAIIDDVDDCGDDDYHDDDDDDDDDNDDDDDHELDTRVQRHTYILLTNTTPFLHSNALIALFADIFTQSKSIESSR